MNDMKRFEGIRALVTGGAGFIGSNLVRALVREGAEVTVVDNLFSGRRENLADIEDELVFMGINVSQAKRSIVVGAIKNIDIIFHLACRNIIVSTTEPDLDFEVNARGTFDVLTAAMEMRDKTPKVIYASSASVYGNARHLPICEDDRTFALNPYAASKLAGEAYCQAFHESYGLPVTILRYSNVYGPYQRPDNPYCGVVAKFFEAAMNDKPALIHGNGLQTRDFTYVDDVVEATLRAALTGRQDGSIYNVGTGFETSVNQLETMVGMTVGKSREPEYVDRRDIDNITRRALNVGKVRRALRWIPEVSLQEGLSRTYEWLKKNRN